MLCSVCPTKTALDRYRRHVRSHNDGPIVLPPVVPPVGPPVVPPLMPPVMPPDILNGNPI